MELHVTIYTRLKLNLFGYWISAFLWNNIMCVSHCTVNKLCCRLSCLTCKLKTTKSPLLFAICQKVSSGWARRLKKSDHWCLNPRQFWTINPVNLCLQSAKHWPSFMSATSTWTDRSDPSPDLKKKKLHNLQTVPNKIPTFNISLYK